MDYDDLPTDAPGSDSPEDGPASDDERTAVRLRYLAHRNPEDRKALYLARAAWARARWAELNAGRAA